MSRRIVVLTGAGISAESGIRTFRAADGLWEDHRPEDVATPEAFEADPALVHRFYNARRAHLSSDGVEPNAAHLALARLEQEYDGDVLIVTQNIDDLHERAGSRNVLHLHGELLKMSCTECAAVRDAWPELGVDSICPGCGVSGRLRPHVVWFGEMPIGLEGILEALEDCSVFAAVGTSGNVYPAAGFVHVAAAAGAQTVELNLEPSEVSFGFAEVRRGPAASEVPRWVDEVLTNQ
ncbi:Sir2 family NAD+-dependent deacetylase [Zhihengliuella sp.]|uniref:Sir2 family NAD+-dependent deacetylase n=1 Tax=Zhihengliuella sp. TaxID=1954483 RepID=UPI00281200EF|nr:Sir2 family NAD+-dependent deacetylase [Zhihengliuella sp.]